MKLKQNHAALKGNGRSIHVKMLRRPSAVGRILKSAKDNDKIGKGRSLIVKGKWKGMPLYLLTLEERKTCPKSCDQWRECYGNGSTFAHRIDHTAANFLPLLETELNELAEKHPNGFVVRLHILGDFYSAKYVNFWFNQLIKLPALHIYGYTHRKPGTAIGAAIRAINIELPNRWAVRYSDAPGEKFSANVVTVAQLKSGKPPGIICPEQTGKTESCLTCGLCWALPETEILFIDHDDKNSGRFAEWQAAQKIAA